MRKLIMKMSVSVDGFVAGLNSKSESDWIFRSSDETSRAWLLGEFNEMGMFIMGRKSFETLAAFWPTAAIPMAKPMNELPKALFTKTGFKGATIKDAESPAAATWTGARIFDGDLAAGIQQLKSEDGKPICALGGAGFMRSLVATGLIDEYIIVTHPVLLGEGLPIFNGVAQPMDLKLIEAKSFPGGIVVHRYRPA